MALLNLRRLVATHCVWWCMAAIVLSALQPFLFNHFRQDGWDAEPGFRVRNAEATALFWPDKRVDHKQELETTLYAAAGAHLDVPDAFRHGLDDLRAMVLLLAPLTVVLPLLPVPVQRIPGARIPFTSGAPPPAALWRNQPPKTAPPSTV